MKNCLNKFLYYCSGMKKAEIFFYAKEIEAKKVDPKNLTLNPIEKVEKNDPFFFMPLHFILENWDEYRRTIWKDNSIMLSWGDIYNKHITVTNDYAQERLTAQYWVQRNKKIPLDIITVDNEIIAFIFVAGTELHVMVKPGYELFTPLKQWEDSAVSKSIHGINHIGTYMVSMNDGIKLATDVWLPNSINENEKIPAILIRTPYGRYNLARGSMRFVHRGYAVVIQDVRGREDSEGEWIPAHYEIEDGNESLYWIANQDWSNQKIGMIGGSYSGYVQWAAAASGNPHLKAIVSMVTAGGPFIDIPKPGGAFMSGNMAWSFAMSKRKFNPGLIMRDDWDTLLKTRPIINIPKKGLGEDISFIKKWLENEEYNDFWKKGDWSIYGDKIDVPALLISGWYDDNGRGTTQAWEMCKKNNRDNIRMILGPWCHNLNTTRDINNIPFGNDAVRYDLGIQHLKWFDRFLKDIDNKVENEDKVQYYFVGENKWYSSDTWPPKEVEITNLYITSDGQGNTSNGNGKIVFKPEEDKFDAYMFDPQNATPFLIDVSENETSVPQNYKEIELRDDVLVYTSEIIQEDIAIAGYVYAEFYALSSCKDTDWVVRLTDVDEEGNSIRLTDGMIRAKFRNSFEKPELLEPGKIEKYEIQLRRIANVFKKGHRIRVEITSGAENLVFPNHNTGNHPAYDTKYIIAQQKIYHGKKYPSCIKIPLITSFK